MFFRTPLAELAAYCRQLRYPPALRIAPPAAPVTAEVLALVELLRAPTPAEPPSPPTAAVDERRLIAAMCTSAWNLRRRMLDPETNRPRAEFRRAYSDVKALWREFDDRGIRIIGHTGEEYDDGLSLDVVTFEERDDVTTQTIIETIKPTIVFDGTRIQIGEVVVGTPRSPDDIARRS